MLVGRQVRPQPGLGILVELDRGGQPAAAVVFELNKVAITLPTYKRIAGITLVKEPLPRTRLGKIQRHLVQFQHDLACHGRFHDSTLRARNWL